MFFILFLLCLIIIVSFPLFTDASNHGGVGTPGKTKSSVTESTTQALKKLKDQMCKNVDPRLDKQVTIGNEGLLVNSDLASLLKECCYLPRGKFCINDGIDTALSNISMSSSDAPPSAPAASTASTPSVSGNNLCDTPPPEPVTSAPSIIENNLCRTLGKYNEAKVQPLLEAYLDDGYDSHSTGFTFKLTKEENSNGIKFCPHKKWDARYELQNVCGVF